MYIGYWTLNKYYYKLSIWFVYSNQSPIIKTDTYFFNTKFYILIGLHVKYNMLSSIQHPLYKCVYLSDFHKRDMTWRFISDIN